MVPGSEKPQEGIAYLPASAYFAAGRGPLCSALVTALNNAGFADILGPKDGQACTQFTIQPEGGDRIVISPPGTTPRVQYDVGSQITLLGTSMTR